MKLKALMFILFILILLKIWAVEVKQTMTEFVASYGFNS